MKKTIEPIRIELSLGLMFQTVNCYLVSGDQLSLIDCGLHSEDNWKSFQEQLNGHGYQVSDIEQLIITHEHRDHIGLLPEIMAHSSAVIRAPKVIEGCFFQPEKLMETERRFALKLFRAAGLPEEKLRQTDQFFGMTMVPEKIEEQERFQFFEEGDHLHIGNTDWEVLCTPGHCPTQFVFLQKEEKRLFAGDMLLPIAPMPIISEDPDKPGQPIRALNDLLTSFERLRSFEIQTVYPGHGEIYADANAMIDKQLARMKMRKEECFEAIKGGLTTPYQVNRKMYPYQNTPPNFSGLYMVLGYADLLEEESRIVKTIDEKGNMKWKIK